MLLQAITKLAIKLKKHSNTLEFHSSVNQKFGEWLLVQENTLGFRVRKLCLFLNHEGWQGNIGYFGPIVILSDDNNIG